VPALRLRHDPGLWVLSELPRAPAARKTFRDPADRRGGRAARRRCRSRGVLFGVDRTKTRRSRGELERIADDRISGRDDCAVDRGRIRICIRRGSAGGLACAIRATIERLGISRSVSSADGGPWERERTERAQGLQRARVAPVDQYVGRQGLHPLATVPREDPRTAREGLKLGVYRAEYIWIDGTQPTQKLRSKTKIVPDGEKPPIWAFDGSSTQQATGDKSDCVLQPVFVCPDPIRGGDNKLVLCEVMLVNGQPHVSNMRRANVDMAKRFEEFDTWFGIEQEYTFFEGSRPLGFPDTGFPAPQGGYYCGVGADEVFGRDVVEAHLDACLRAGLKISGINAEVMPGQWEFQVGPLNAPEIGDQLWVARWLLYRVGEDYGVSATLYPKPVRGDWNGAGAHTNFSTNEMRENYDACVAAAEALGKRHDLHIANYGFGIEERLTGLHETCSYKEFRYGVSDRGASVRIPWQVAKDRKGYIEDRRPNANADPYVTTRLIIETVCGAETAGRSRNGSRPARDTKVPSTTRKVAVRS